MNLLDIARELRLQIYSEVLVLSEPIVFVADDDSPSRPLFWSEKDELCPALLRVNKLVYNEASPILYSKNCFQFPDVLIATPSRTLSAHIAPFLHQIGCQASHIRHICIPFPDFDELQDKAPALYQADIDNLDLVRTTCSGIRTLELLVSRGCADYTLGDLSIAAHGLDLLNIHFKRISTLEQVGIIFQVYHEHDLSNALTESIHDYGWAVKMTKLPKKIWISQDARVEFDNEEDCKEYDYEQALVEEGERERKEEEEWVEEYHSRRRDPYWKNDSDYD
jgi:hypothetical protein